MKKPNVACPITKVAQLLSDTWTILILHFLLERPQRFCDLEKSLNGISTRTLTLKLKKLIADGMIIKAKDGYYTITSQGKGLRVVENAMKRYQKQYL